jgi:O-antigen ligase
MSTAVRDVLQHPLFGTGIGFQNGPLFGETSHKIVTDGFWWAIMLEGGIIGLALVLVLFFVMARALWNAYKQNGHDWSLIGALTLATLFVTGFVNSALANQNTSVAVYLLLGLCLATSNFTPERPTST